MRRCLLVGFFPRQDDIEEDDPPAGRRCLDTPGKRRIGAVAGLPGNEFIREHGRRGNGGNRFEVRGIESCRGEHLGPVDWVWLSHGRASVGVPLVLSDQCDLAPELAAAGAALQIPMDPERAAEAVAAWLAVPEEVAAAGARGRAWRAAHCSAAVVGAQMVEFYTAARRAGTPP